MFQTRLVAGAAEALVEKLQWAGLSIDEGILAKCTLNENVWNCLPAINFQIKLLYLFFS